MAISPMYLPPSNPREYGLQNLISQALSGYHGGVNAKYAQKEKEANIFNKEIGPLASLASSPNFTGFNPQVQHMLAQRIGSYLSNQGGQGGNQNYTEQASPPGYASGEDIFNRIEEGTNATESPKGRSDLNRSNFGGWLEKYIGANPISHALGGHNAISQKGSLEQAKTEAIQNLKLRGYPEAEAKSAFTILPGESAQAYLKRVKSLLIASQNADASFPNNNNTQFSNVNNKAAADERTRADAEATAKAFKTTPEKVLEAQQRGIKTQKQFKEFLARSQ